MIDVGALLIELGQKQKIGVDAVSAKNENKWIGIMIGRLKPETSCHTIDYLVGYDVTSRWDILPQRSQLRFKWGG